MLTGVNLIAVVVVINILLSFAPNVRLDLTNNKIHSLSKTSELTLQKLEDVVNVKVYISSELPPEIKPLADNLKLTINEFESINPGKFKVTYLDPLKSESVRSEAEKNGIQPLQFSNIKSDKFEVSNGYFGLVMTYGDKKEVLPVAGDVGNLEYFLVTGIRRLVNNKSTGVLLAINEDNADNGYQLLNEYMGKVYKTTEINLGEEVKLTEENEVMVIVNPQTDLVKNKEAISLWLKQGKGLVFFADQIGVDVAMGSKQNPIEGWKSLFKEYGIEYGDKMLVDQSSTLANFRGQKGNFLTQYPFWIQIRTENINNTLPILSGVTSLMVPWTTGLSVSGQARPLFSSSSQSQAVDGALDVSPYSKVSWESGKMKKTVVGAINTEGVRLAVIADSDMLRDQFLRNNQQNLVLALNLTDYFSQDKSLMEIRSKNVKSSPLKPVEEMVRLAVKGGLIVSPLLLTLLVAGAAKIVRNKNQKRYG